MNFDIRVFSRFLLLFLLSLSPLFFQGCTPLVPNLHEYDYLDSDTKFKVLSENDKGFELGVYIHHHGLSYTDETRLTAEAKNTFKHISRLICKKKGKVFGSIDDNTFISIAKKSKKEAHVRNWVNYQ